MTPRRMLFSTAIVVLAGFALVTIRQGCQPESLILGPLGAIFGHCRLSAPDGLVKPGPVVHPHVAHVEGSIYGHYTPSDTITPGDTLPVIVDIDIRPGDTLAVIRIGADTVAIDSLRFRGTVSPLNWRLFCEGAMAGSPELAVGVAWEPVRPLGIQAGPFVSVAVPDGEWLAGGMRISRRWHSTLDAGAEIGYRLGIANASSGVHVGLSAGFAF